jgi:hypothetical protein
MKFQACRFKATEDSIEESGIALVVEFDLHDIHWIVDSKGTKHQTVWSYKLTRNKTLELEI